MTGSLLERDVADALAERIGTCRRVDGGWGYRSKCESFAEPTALCAIAMSLCGRAEPAMAGCRWLAKLQRDDGGVPISPAMTEPCWPTALAVWAWQVTDARAFDANIAVGCAYLLRTVGKPFPKDRRMFGHDTTLRGWTWTSETHSWVEPTSYSIIALSRAGFANHPRVLEGLRLLRDRELSGGGWNYGNTRVFDSMLRSFPMCTGVALTALATAGVGDSHSPTCDNPVRELASASSPLSLSWSVIGLRSWGRLPDAAEASLTVQAERVIRGAPAHYAAMILIASATDRAFKKLVQTSNEPVSLDAVGRASFEL